MRPLSLVVEGFTCFSERQAPLDFRTLHLFAIAGPTGAGKSSILDAMTFALYGYVPRLGKAGADLITTGRDRLAVQFEFAVGERTFRVARTLRRKQGAKIVLEETTAGRVRPLSDKVADANAAIQRLIGIGYDGFSQSVVLPQGRFDTFLRGAGGDRRELLKGLLGLERYELMRRAAVERRAELDRQIAACEQVLATLAHATAERLDAKRADLAAADCEAARRAAREREIEQQVLALRQRRQLTIELEQKTCELARLDGRAEAIAAAWARLQAAQRATPLIPVIDAAEASAERLARSTGELDGARGAERQASDMVRSASEAHARAVAAASDAASLRSRVDALNRIHGPLLRLRAVAARQPALDNELRQTSREAERARSAADRARATHLEAAAARDAARHALDAIGYDAPLHERLQSLVSDAVRAADVDARLRALRTSRESLSADVAATRQQSARARAAAHRALEAVEVASAEFDAARRALDEAHRAQMAGVLRRSLCAGERCPVCDQDVGHVPSERVLPELAAPEARHRAALQTLEKARGDLKAREEDAVAARTRAAERRDSLARLDADIAAVAAQLAESDERIRLALAGVTGALPGEIAALPDPVRAMADLRRWVLDESVRLDGLRREADSARAALDAAERRAQAAEAAAVAAHHALTAAEAAHARADNEAAANARERTTLAAEIAAVTAADDPDAERRELEIRIAALEQRLREAERALAAAQMAYGAATAALEAANSRAEEDRRDANQRAEAASLALRAAGFDTPSAVRAAVVGDAERQALQREIDGHEGLRQKLLGRLQELQERLAGAAVPADALAAAEEEYDRCRVAHTDAVKRAASARVEVAQLEVEVARADDTRDALQRNRRAFDVADVLARELGGDRFQQYLLEDTLEQLVRGASVRLQELSGRYTLDWREDRFHVIDHDNARERRVADTLSGGETFLASLALALELSEQIQRAAGAVRIDSLFIDEGFGTLDPDTLSVVAEAIEALQVGGRMVGIITHLEELTERLPGCIRIAKRPGQGSTWSVERTA